MIWNDKYLFLHYPKAAGKSLSVAMIKSWQSPVQAYISKGQILELGGYIEMGSTLYVEGAHQNVIRAQRILNERHDRDIESFEAVFLAVRNPYDLICSTYYFHRQSVERGATNESFALAANSSLAEFIRHVKVAGYKGWMTLNGETLSNLRIIRFENMAEDFERHAEELSFEPARIPHLNSGQQRDYSNLITPELEEIVFEKYKYLFDVGLYTRRTEFDG